LDGVVEELPVVAINLISQIVVPLSEALPMRRDDGSDTDIALNEPHLALRVGTPVLIRRLVAEDAAFPIF
jgi:hypothetical protein